MLPLRNKLHKCQIAMPVDINSLMINIQMAPQVVCSFGCPGYQKLKNNTYSYIPDPNLLSLFV